MEEDVGLGLDDTPQRVADMYLDELFATYKPDAPARLQASMKVFPAGDAKELVIETNIPFVSTCAHHLLPFTGSASVGFIPNAVLPGLSKIPRVIDYFSRKLQMQERLTTEIADYLEGLLQPHSLIVYLEAEHHCMACRGVRKAGIITMTSALRGGALKDPSIKSEFLTLIGRHTRWNRG